VDPEDVQEDIDRTTAIGLENLEILTLAANWCEHIDLDSRHMGVGLIQQATGLPISGGNLRCEFAEAPRSFGMVLKNTAAEFYEQNCVGCPHHKPTGREPTLATWADPIIAGRNEVARRAEEERRAENERRLERAARRRFLVGTPDPAVQAILDLMDRIDAEDRDPEAEGLLLKTAELSPQDFPSPLLEHLAAEGSVIRRDSLLDVVFKVFELSGRPPLDRVLALSFAAIGTGFAATSAGRIISTNATAIPDDAATRRGIIGLAAGAIDFHHGDWEGSEPDALVRFFDVDPVGAAQAIGSLLRDEEAWARSTGAHAARALVRTRPAAGSALVDPLLDCVVIRDGSRYLGDPWPSSTAADVVADVLFTDPTADESIVERMRGAAEREMRALWKCYWHAAPSRFRDPVPNATLDLIERRATALLKEDLPLGALEEISETFSHLTDDHDGSVGVPLAELIGLLRQWNTKVREADAHRPPDPSPVMAFLEWEHERIRTKGIARNIEEAVEGRAKQDVLAYVDAVGSMWDATLDPPLTEGDRASLVKGLSVTKTQEALDRAEPLLVRVLSAGSVVERAAALGALEDIGWRDLRMASSIQRLIVSNLTTHDRLWVIVSAIRALRVVELETGERPAVVQFLVNFAAAYKREQSDDAERALGWALEFASGEPYEQRVRELGLEIVNGMASSDAADALDHLHALRTGPDWVAAVIRALADDDRGGLWYGVHEGRKDDLLRLLSTVPTAWLEPNWDALDRQARTDLDLDGSWTWAIADLLARHGQHHRAADLAQAIVDGTPDTRERRHRRRLAKLVTYGHRINAAADDPDAVRDLIAEAAALAEEEATDDA
jgi:hypothetical protein